MADDLYVLDTSAIFAFTDQEEGADAVEKLLDSAQVTMCQLEISAISLVIKQNEKAISEREGLSYFNEYAAGVPHQNRRSRAAHPREMATPARILKGFNKNWNEYHSSPPLILDAKKCILMPSKRRKTYESNDHHVAIARQPRQRGISDWIIRAC